MNISSASVVNPRFVALETGIPYDWDDYEVWGDVLFDTVENKIVTVKYGHGVGPKIDGGCCSLDEAIENNIVTCEALIDVMFKALGIGFDNANIISFAVKHSIENPLGIPVTVTGGRKFKGAGYLIAATEAPQRYGLGAYQGEKVHKYLIYSPEKNDYFVVNSFSYLQFEESTKNAWNDACRAAIENNQTNVLSLAHAWAYAMSYSACDTENRAALITRYSNAGKTSLVVPNEVTDATNIYVEKKRLEHESRMNEELPKLVEWVRSKGYKTTEEEIIEEAKRIWKKNN